MNSKMMILSSSTAGKRSLILHILQFIKELAEKIN